ncbi:tyrosine-type recombinase/integrase [Allokutzneria albata]|uniref:Phage integrase, N-terminal SAM-like domain n=1 Tax=Allokutzneria albata TaxID=211114 RepID=A0A1G9Y8P4_ALLAB|nr:tyrosine-type recombinase/integrase [Allokutzneria albata]SDN05397.1 Phage integrase, N-terminal SAM-like domain [Allokutzneria albata]
MPWSEPSGANSWRVRFRRDDGTIGSLPGFPTQRAADDHINDMKSEQRKGIWLDPTAGQIPLGDYVPEWLDGIDVSIRTEQNYRSLLDNHILPRWKTTPLNEITNRAARAWEKKLRAEGKLAPVTIDGILKLLTLILADAADEKLIAANPIRPRRRGRRTSQRRRPRTRKVWAQPVEAVHAADNAAAIYGPGAALLLITGAWTGARWGELTGLHRDNVHLFDDDTGYLAVDPDIGALHEDDHGNLFLGPPKTEKSARTITLPPFLVRLLRAHLATHPHPHVFVTATGAWHRRSNFSRRAMKPAADGTQHLPYPKVLLMPAKPGLTFHGFRHGHKTWMIADGIPEVAQADRLGHEIPDKVREAYSHVAPEVEARLLQALQERWEKALANLADTALDTRWRAAT